MEDIIDKMERNRKRYEGSEKGKAKNKRWNQSDRGKESRKKYLDSELGQAAILRYLLSEKAETQRQKRRALEKLFRLTDKYLKENPEATIEEALRNITGGLTQ